MRRPAATAWLASFMALSAAINAGFVYEASWGPANAREVAESAMNEASHAVATAANA